MYSFVDLPLLRLSLSYNNVRRPSFSSHRKEHGGYGIFGVRIHLRHGVRVLFGAAPDDFGVHWTGVGVWDYSLRLLWYYRLGLYVLQVVDRYLDSRHSDGVSCNRRKCFRLLHHQIHWREFRYSDCYYIYFQGELDVFHFISKILSFLANFLNRVWIWNYWVKKYIQYIFLICLITSYQYDCVSEFITNSSFDWDFQNSFKVRYQNRQT